MWPFTFQHTPWKLLIVFLQITFFIFTKLRLKKSLAKRLAIRHILPEIFTHITAMMYSFLQRMIQLNFLLIATLTRTVWILTRGFKCYRLADMITLWICTKTFCKKKFYNRFLILSVLLMVTQKVRCSRKSQMMASGGIFLQIQYFFYQLKVWKNTSRKSFLTRKTTRLCDY